MLEIRKDVGDWRSVGRGVYGVSVQVCWRVGKDVGRGMGEE